MPPAAAGEAQSLIDQAAHEAGRDPGDIRRIYNMPGAFIAGATAATRDTDQAIVGPPDHWTDVLTHLALDVGFDTFVLMGAPDPRMLRTFIEDVPNGPRARRECACRGRGDFSKPMTIPEPTDRIGAVGIIGAGRSACTPCSAGWESRSRSAGCRSGADDDAVPRRSRARGVGS
jgi:hypothetical protein